MDLMLKYEPKQNDYSINYNDQILLVGSCFTEHIGNFLKEHKFKVLQNPNGILFDTLSVCRSITSYIENKKVTIENLFFQNELWQSWQHHSMFSNEDKQIVLNKINQSQDEAFNYLKKTSCLIITLGSSYSYKLNNEIAKDFAIDDYVANCHKAPANFFEKCLISIDEQIAQLDKVIHRLRLLNPNIKIIFTISPVRHTRDGVVENNRSKARLIEVVHHLINKFNNLYYFPAYELLIDVLRDYRFYDIDLVHPNFLGTNIILKHFIQSFVDNESQKLLEKIKPIIIARKHKPFNPNSIAHQKFKQQNIDSINILLKEYSYLDFKKELEFFMEKS